MSRRTRQIRTFIEKAAEACAAVVEEAAQQTGDLRLGEVLHAQLDCKPNEIIVLAKFENSRGPQPFELRCHVCEELLSQRSVASYPVRLPRPDGTWFAAVLMTCADEACHTRLMEKLDTEGP